MNIDGIKSLNCLRAYVQRLEINEFIIGYGYVICGFNEILGNFQYLYASHDFKAYIQGFEIKIKSMVGKSKQS